MDTPITLLVLCAFASAVNGVVALWSYLRRHKMRAALAFSALNVADMAWNVGHLAETLAPDLETKLLWDSLQNIPVAALGPIALWVGFDYLEVRMSRRFWWTISGIAIASALPLATEPLHHLFRHQAELQGTPAMLTYPFGLLDLVLSLPPYATSLVAFVMLVRVVSREPEEYVPQRLALAFALVTPLVATTIGMTLSLRIDGDRDISPVSTMLSAAVAAWGLAWHRLFALSPIASATVIAALADGVIVIDQAGRVTDMNRAATLLSSSAIGTKYREAFADWPAVLALLEKGETRTCDVGSAPRSPKQFYEATCTQLTDSEGEVRGHTLVLRDVSVARERLAHATTERHQAEAALAVSEERFGALFDQTFQLTGLLDREGRVLAANRAALQMVAASAKDVVGQLFWETPWWTHSSAQQALLRDAIERCARGEFVRFQAEHVDASGKAQHIDFSLTPIRNAEGHVVEMVPEGRDVTALHEERARADQLSTQLQQAQRLDSMGRLAGGLAHDFNNLLTVIGCSVDLANEEVPAETTVREYLASIREAATAAGEITRGLLAFGRQQPVLTRPINLRDVVAATQKLTRRLIRENVRITVESAEDVADINADHGQLQQVVMNLVLNAQDAMPSGGGLRITIHNAAIDAATAGTMVGARSGDFVCLKVIDNGTGMPVEVLSRIFEPFFSTKELGKGTGLGLSIVHGVVTQNGGWIDVRSTPGAGTAFALYFPRTVSQSQAPLARSDRTSETLRRVRIHVVDDQSAVLQTMKRVLEGEGHEVHSFGSAAEVLSAEGRHGEPELLVTDLVLPTINGLELADTLAARLPNLRVLIVSGYAESAQLDLIARLPPEALLAKPFTPAELLDKVNAALSTLPPWSALAKRIASKPARVARTR